MRELMEQQILVRPIQIADASSVATLLSEAFYTSGSWLSWVSPVLKLGIYQDLRNRCLAPPPQYTCLIGLQASEHHRQHSIIVGTVEVAAKPLLWGTSRTPVPYVSNLAVMSSFRRQGVGRQLLLACEQVVQRWGNDELYLHVQGENQAARKLYASLGYRLHQAEIPLLARLLGHPQQLLLRKPLNVGQFVASPK